MKVIVDTSVWSLALRREGRNSPPGKNVETGESRELRKLITEGNVAIIGPIRQELLSGIREPAQFERVRAKLASFRDVNIETGDYETAAAFFNRCRTNGIQGSNTDFLICALAVRKDLPILTTDGDFTLFKKHLPIVLHKVRDVHISNIRSH